MLSADAITASVYAQHLLLFPQATVQRSNEATGVPEHVVVEEFLRCVVTALVATMHSLTIYDLGSGVTGVPPGVAAPAAIALPSAPAAALTFLAEQGWTGVHAAAVATSFVANVLQTTASNATLQMGISTAFANGTGVVSPATNPGLYAAAESSLLSTLPAAFTNSGFFAQDDQPGNAVNAVLAAQLPRYAAAYAAGLASLTATVAYVGTPGSTAPVTGIVNAGALL